MAAVSDPRWRGMVLGDTVVQSETGRNLGRLMVVQWYHPHSYLSLSPPRELVRL